MKEMTIGALKSKFSMVIDEVLSGEEYVVLKGKDHKKVAMLVPYDKEKEKTEKPKKRSIGKDKGKIIIKDDFDELPDDILKSFGIE